MVCLKLTLILLICVLKVYSSDTIEENGQYAPHVSAILKHLNSNPNKLYNYKIGIFISSQQKADILELAVDVNVTCSVTYPGVPCTEQVLTCNGFLQYIDGEYKVLSDVLCKPKRDASVENLDESSTIPVLSERESKIELSHESVSSEQNADFVAVKPDTVPCVGCPFDLNPDVEGVSSLIDTTLRHIESEKDQKHIAIKVIRLQQQVVAGIKYILTVEIAPTVCQKNVDSLTSCPLDTNAGSSVCHVIFLQKPWISKEKLVIANNCTISQDYAPENKQSKRNDMSNEINTNREYDKTNNKKEMNSQRLADLESQILARNIESTKPVSTRNIQREPNVESLQYQGATGYPSNNQLFTSFVKQNSERDRLFIVKLNPPENPVSPNNICGNSVTSGLHTAPPGENVFSENNVEQKSTGELSYTLIPPNNQPDSTKQGTDENPEVTNKMPNNEQILLQGIRRLRREISETEELDRFKREPDSSSSSNSSESQENNKKQNAEANSDSSESHEDKKEVTTVQYVAPRRKRNLDTNSDSSGSQGDDNTGESIRSKRDVNYSSNNVGKQKRSSSSSSSSSSSESKTKEDKNKIDNKDDSSSSSSSSEDKSKEKIKEKHKKNKRSSSSSSSSSSSESKAKEDKNKNDNKNDSSSSSSSSEDKSKEKIKEKHKKNENDGDSSSDSSSSSENKSREQDIKISKVKRSIGQLEKITQEEKFLVRDLADFAASALDSLDDDNHKRIILQILSAKKLKLDGIYFHIILRLGISQCSENEEGENCREKLFPNLTKICKVLVHVEDDLSNPQVVKSQCQSTRKDERDRNRTNYSRYRRGLVGAPSNMSFDDPRILEFTRNTLTELDSKSEHSNRHDVVKILSATSQVVAGAKYEIKVIISLTDCLKNDTKLLEECEVPPNATLKTCNIVVWDRPWLNLQETTVKCDDDDKEFSFTNNNTKPRKNRSFSNKIVSNNDMEKPTDNKNTPSNLGGIQEESPDNQKANRYLKDILTYLDSESGHHNKLKIQDVMSVEKQVVAGELWRIKAKVALSECPKSKEIDPQLCKQLEGSESRTCLFKIWDRPWLPNGREVQTTCENESKPYSFRLKRSLGHQRYIIPSSVDDKNKPNPQVLQYVKTGLRYLDSQSVYKTKYVIKNILKVAQDAANKLWHVKAEIILSDCSKDYSIEYCDELENTESKMCQFVILEQPPLSTPMQINITCKNDKNVYSFSDNNIQHIHSDLLSKFRNFIVKHNKNYSNNSEFDYRLKVFRSNLITITLLNSYEKGTGQYGITQFADLTTGEFSKLHGLRTDLRNENEAPFSNAVIPDIELPTEFDWRNKGAVTEVKDQGSCGSCWAFSTTGNIEGQYAIKYGKLLEFSEQELVDCDKLDEGCNGGLMDNAYRTIEKIGGLETESDYPYDAKDEKCYFNKSKVQVQLNGALNISHNEDDMAKWLVKNGPISIAINANAMQFYVGGVSHPWKILCSPKSLDHGVLIVGYGIHTYPLFNRTLPYWLVKNSWGKSWGEQGYYRVFRGDGTCGVNQTPSSAIVT